MNQVHKTQQILSPLDLASRWDLSPEKVSELLELGMLPGLAQDDGSYITTEANAEWMMNLCSYQPGRFPHAPLRLKVERNRGYFRIKSAFWETDWMVDSKANRITFLILLSKFQYGNEFWYNSTELAKILGPDKTAEAVEAQLLRFRKANSDIRQLFSK